MTKYKYLIIFPFNEPYAQQERILMDEISKYTRTTPSYEKLTPHITFHKPIVNINKTVIRNLTKSLALRSKKTLVSLGSPHNFGERFIVRPVFATKALAGLWLEINDILSHLPEYEHGEYDNENTLHETLAEVEPEMFNIAWEKTLKMNIAPIHIVINTICIYEKEIKPGSKWNKIACYLLR